MKKLPTANYPIHNFLIPSLGREYRFRPFLVKENKALMIAQGSEDQKVMIETLKSVIQSCLMDETVNVDDLTVFDCEYLLIKLRAISIGEEITVMLNCSDEHEGNEASRIFGVACDLNKVEVVGLEDYNPCIKLSDNLMIKMSAPTIDTLISLTKNTENEYEENFKLIVTLIKEIITTEEVIDCSEIEPKELVDWVNELPTDEYEKILRFIQNLPKVRIKVEWDCPYCGKHNTRYLQGLMVFF